jgi:hypothetical protein
MILSTVSYSVLYDLQKPMVFVGTTFYNTMLYEYFAKTRSCYIFQVEEIEHNDQSWFDQYQFMSAVSNVKTKYFLINRLANKHPHYVSIMGTGNTFANVDIGQNTFIQNYNVCACQGVSIGNHCTVGNFNTIGHDTMLSDYCHVSSYCLTNFSKIGTGSCIASRTTMIGKLEKPTITPDHCNFTLGSVINKSIDQPGTYFGSRRQSAETSLTYKIL